MEELSSARNLANAYGLGLEAVLWDGARFRYIEKVTFAFWNMDVVEGGLRMRAANASVIYRSYDTFSVLQLTEFEHRDAASLRAKRTDVDVITPLHTAMPYLLLDGLLQSPEDSRFLFTGVGVTSRDKKLHARIALVTDPKDTEGFATYRGGMLKLNAKAIWEMLPAEVLA